LGGEEPGSAAKGNRESYMSDLRETGRRTNIYPRITRKRKREPTKPSGGREKIREIKSV